MMDKIVNDIRVDDLVEVKGTGARMFVAATAFLPDEGRLFVNLSPSLTGASAMELVSSSELILIKRNDS